MEQGIRTDYNSKEDKRRNIQNTETAPNIKYKHDLHVVHQLACIGCTIIGLSCWNYNKYDRVQRHCIKLAYCLRNQHLPPEKHPRITATPWWDEVSNANILTSQACTPNSSLIWFGHVYCMVGRILKDIFCGEMAAGKWITDRPHLRLVNVCKRDMRALDIDLESWACLEADHTRWRRTLNQRLQSGEEKLMKAEADKRARRKKSSNPIRPETTHICDLWSSDRHVRSCLDWRAIGCRYVVTETPHGPVTHFAWWLRLQESTPSITIPPATQGTVTTTSTGHYCHRRCCSSRADNQID